VVTGQRGTYVYVVDSSNTARERPVVVERTTHGVAIITTGVSEGERVVTDGQSRLNPGATVDIRSANDSGGTGGRRGGRGGRGKADSTGKSGAAPAAPGSTTEGASGTNGGRGRKQG
jgi:multidrug efflux system membrane fusion protein